MSQQTEAEKLSQHLSLLRSEYVKLQQKCTVLERENSMLSAQAGKGGVKDSFVCKLLATVASLYNKPLYSDLTIITTSSNIHAHKFVLSARSSSWMVSSLSEVESLDWTDMEEDVSLSLLQWIYTDQISFSPGDRFTLALMAAASKFELSQLVDVCEQSLVAAVCLANCVRFYATAHSIGAARLREHCSQLIASNWDKFTHTDFQDLAPELVYDMLKARAEFPLHSAIQLLREDVVFLYLIEFNAELSLRINEVNSSGHLPLDLALAADQYGIAASLVEHQADPDRVANSDRGLPLLHAAVARSDPKACLFLLRHGAGVNVKATVSGDTALHMIAAVDAKSTELLPVAEELIKRSADLDAKNSTGETPLHKAVIAGNTPVFDLMLDNKANLDLLTIDGLPTLWHALQGDYGGSADSAGSMASRLVAAGANVSTDCGPAFAGNSLLHCLAEDGLEEAGLFLVSSGADVNRVNRRGESVLHMAAKRGLATLATALLIAGADPNIQTTAAASHDDNESRRGVTRQTALHIALLHRQEAVVSCLLEFSRPDSSGGLTSVLLDLNLRNSEDATPLALTLALPGLTHLAEQMIDCGADVNITDSNTGLSLLHQAILGPTEACMAGEVGLGGGSGGGHVASALFLLSHGADVNSRCPQGQTPLELAVRRGDPTLEAVIERLCLAGADTATSSTGEPPLWIALMMADGDEDNDGKLTSSLDVASILVRHGVDTDAWAEGPDGCEQTLLHLAIDENRTAAACFLVRAGCDLNAARRPGPGGSGGEEAKDGQGPLHLAAQWGQEELVACLLEHGADLNRVDSEGRTVLHHAIEAGHQGIINMLLGSPGIDLTTRDKSGLSPFAAAMTYKNNSAARVILELEPGAAEQHDSRGKNFLHTAIIKGDLESLLFLISINVNVHSRTTDANKLAPILLAVQQGNEMMVRNLILAGANVQERTLTGQSGLVLAALLDYPEIASVLLNNNIDYAAVDEAGNNALHVAVREGNVRTARVLLTESRINAETFNNKGRSPFHVLAQFSDNANALFDLFVECMPDYPVDKPDIEGNTPLLLAYVKGSGDLCRALVKRGAILGTMNKNMVNIFNHPVATKQLLYRLLDILSVEPRWGEGDFCEECQAKFGLTTRKHHCRHCGRLLCGKCSAKEMPIMKYNLTKPVRVCEVCSDLLTLGVAAGV